MVVELVRDPENGSISLLVDNVEVLGSLDENQADMALLGAGKVLDKIGIPWERRDSSR